MYFFHFLQLKWADISNVQGKTNKQNTKTVAGILMGHVSCWCWEKTTCRSDSTDRTSLVYQRWESRITQIWLWEHAIPQWKWTDDDGYPSSANSQNLSVKPLAEQFCQLAQIQSSLCWEPRCFSIYLNCLLSQIFPLLLWHSLFFWLLSSCKTPEPESVLCYYDNWQQWVSCGLPYIKQFLREILMWLFWYLLRIYSILICLRT